MSRNKKILLGILTFLPWVFIIFYFIAFFGFFTGLPFEDPQQFEEEPTSFFRGMFGLILLLLLGAAISLGIMIYYLIHMSKNSKIKDTERIVWILVLVFANSIGSLVYFFMHIVPLPEKNEDSALKNYNG